MTDDTLIHNTTEEPANLPSAEGQAVAEAIREHEDRPEIEAPVPVMGEQVSIVQGGADRVEAGTLTVQQGGVNQARAERIDVKQGGIGRAEAAEINLRQGAVGFARAGRIKVEIGAVGAALGERIELSQSMSRFVAARDSVRLEQSGALNVLANEVEFGPQSGTVFLLARTVRGPVHTVFDWRGALAFGAAFGAAVALVRRVFRRR